MKSYFTITQALPAAACVVLCCACLQLAQGADYLWRASWGFFPDQVDSSMSLFNLPTNRLGPVLTNGELVLRTYTTPGTTTDADYMGYDQFANLTMPTKLIIEVEMQFQSGSTVFSGRPPACIYWVGAAGVLGLLGIEDGTIYLGRNQTQHWDTASVSTSDGFHLYRIEVDEPNLANQSATQVRVFLDGVPRLYGPMGGDGANQTGSAPEIYFGDGTDWAYGVSRWRSFRHNAASRPSRPVMFIRRSSNEVSWTSFSNGLYNVEFCADLRMRTWLPLFTNVIGNGNTNAAFDLTPRKEPHRFYRIEVVR